jgi:aminoglycoside phosphotransferase (APT) family kinase protein
LAVLHGLELDHSLAQLQPDLSIEERISLLQMSSERLGNTSPVYALGFDWLRQHIPDASSRCVIHGDFRLGNLLVTESGLSSILDWELAKLSFPEEDLGYLSANAWRFGQPHNPVGGFGQYEALLDAYEQSAGWRPRMSALKYWQFFTSISWGIICLAMRQMYLDGTDRSLERLAIGRRFSAAELDILLLLDELS